MKIGFGDSVEQKSYANRQAMALHGEKPWLEAADLGGYGWGGRRRVLDPRSKDGVIHNEENDRTDDSHQNAVNVHPGDAGHSKRLKQESANHRAYDPERDVQQSPLTGFIDDLAGNESGEQSKHDPCK
jgi:hypothetical protein